MQEIPPQSPVAADWETELRTTAERYHVIASWVAVIFNIVFSVTDYINIPAYWQLFLGVRMAISLVIMTVLLLRKRFNIPSETVIFVPFVLISIQNAFMWSYMDAELMQKHALAYMALFIGAGMLLLWKIRYSVAVVVISLLANFIFLAVNSPLETEQIMASGGLLTGSVAIFSILLIQTRYNLTRREIIARQALEASKRKLEEQKEIIEQNNRDITDSIKYAKRIQDAILPDDELLKKHLKDYFIYFKPKDIVSGDFYWFGRREEENISFMAAVDCTGHGVPGAFMSMIGNTLLNEIVLNNTLNTPAKILFELRKAVIEALEQSGQSDHQEGMDIALVMIEHNINRIQFSGAYNALYLVREGELEVTKADRMPIGRYHNREEIPFRNQVYSIQEGDQYYIFSDGYTDQFGGPHNKKFSTKKFKQIVTKMSTFPMAKQKAALTKTMESWQGSYDQIDDMLVIGIKF